MQIAVINDKTTPLTDLDPAYLDRGTFFGDGVYEVVRSYGGSIFLLREHLERFTHSLEALGIAGVDIDKIGKKVIDAYRHADIANARIYFHITRGSHLRSHTGCEGLRPNFFLTVTELEDDSKQKGDGIAVSTFPDWRWKRCDIKSLNLLANVLARMDAEKKGCKEAILVNQQGQITEGAGSAFFMIASRDRILTTHPLGPEILLSITRQIVMQIAETVGLSVVEKAITPAQAKAADELFIAVTTKDIVPVVTFDGEKLADGKPGEYTRRLMKQFGLEVKRRTSM